MSNVFRVTARDHCGMIIMAALAERFSTSEYLSLLDVAKDMHLSHGYLEEIAASLKAAKLIVGKQGPRGGYRLAKAPEKIQLEEILTALEGPVELVDCQSKSSGCPVSHKCTTKNVWSALQKTIRESLRKTTLANVIQ